MKLHTILPWKNVDGTIVQLGEGGVVTKIAEVYPKDGGKGIEKHNADFIVEACNNFESCLKVLGQLKEKLPPASLISEINLILAKHEVK